MVPDRGRGSERIGELKILAGNFQRSQKRHPELIKELINPKFRHTIRSFGSMLSPVESSAQRF